MRILFLVYAMIVLFGATVYTYKSYGGGSGTSGTSSRGWGGSSGSGWSSGGGHK